MLAELKKCHVILKGPTTTPRAGDPWPNVESANVAMRKELDLFANMRPVKVPEQGIDWTFFRENTEGGYAIGSYGLNITDDLAVDFTVATQEGCERIARLAYEYAKKNNKGKVSIITKANIIKTTDGKFLKTAQKSVKNILTLQLMTGILILLPLSLLTLQEERISRYSFFLIFTAISLQMKLLNFRAA